MAQSGRAAALVRACEFIQAIEQQHNGAVAILEQAPGGRFTERKGVVAVERPRQQRDQIGITLVVSQTGEDGDGTGGMALLQRLGRRHPGQPFERRCLAAARFA